MTAPAGAYGAGMDLPRPRPALVGQGAFTAAGVSYRRLDYWTRVGYLRSVNPDGGSGSRRLWPVVEVAVAVLMVRLTDAGMTPAAAADYARTAAERLAAAPPSAPPPRATAVPLAPGVVLVVTVEAVRAARDAGSDPPAR